MDTRDLEERARDFAVEKHAGQKRKYTDEPYIVHPAEVVTILRRVPHTIEMLAAGWLHDVVEDQGVSFDEIQFLFGTKVMLLVKEVTDVTKPEDGNRGMRKAIECRRLATISPEGKTIKLADLISNTRSIVERDPGFAKVYMREKSELLQMALRGGDETLWQQAHMQVLNYFYGEAGNGNVAKMDR